MIKRRNKNLSSRPETFSGCKMFTKNGVENFVIFLLSLILSKTIDLEIFFKNNFAQLIFMFRKKLQMKICGRHYKGIEITVASTVTK